MSRAATHDGAPLPTNARTIIVGAGLAGLEIANELSRRGADDVLLIEAGPADDVRHVNMAHSPETALRMWLDSRTDTSFVRPWTSLTPPHYTGSSGVRRRLGGRALYWYGVTLPLEEWALADPAWPTSVVRDLRESWRGGESLYARVGARLEAWRERVEPASEPLPLPPETRVGALTLRPTPLARRVDPCSPGSWYAYSALDDWRDPHSGQGLRTPPGVRMLAGAEVVNVVVDDGTAQGVVVRHPEAGVPAQISAEHVVLCAGTLENSRLALQALTEPGHRNPVALPGLADHIVQGLFLRLAGESADQLLKAVPAGSYSTPYGPPARSNLFVDVHAPEDDGTVLLEIRAMGEQLDEGTSWVECTPGDNYPWPVSVHSVPSEADRQLLAVQRDMVRRCYRQMCSSAGIEAQEIEFAPYDAPARGNDFALPESIGTMTPGTPVTWSNVLGTEDHEGGTLPLGQILNEDHQFRSVQGLFAAGPATFPRIGAANPSLTTLALAHRLAALLADTSL